MAFEPIIDRATAPFRGDAELQRELAAELRDHLEESESAFRNAGKTPEESARLAAEAFGEPAEVGEQLLRANFRKLKFRARFRLAIKILTVPVLLLALLAALDWRSLLAGYYLWRLETHEHNDFQHRLADRADRFNADQQIFFYGDDSPLRDPRSPLPLERKRQVYAQHQDDPAYRTWYLGELEAARQNTRADFSPEEFRAELEKARNREPENALYSYWLADLELARAVSAEQFGNAPIQLKNRAALDRAMADLRQGLEAPYCRSHAAARLQERLRLLSPRNDLLGALQRIVTAGRTELPFANRIRLYARLLPFYGRLLVREGKLAEADYYLNAWHRAAAQFNEDSFCLIEQLIIAHGEEVNRELRGQLYRELNRPELAEQLAASGRELRQYRDYRAARKKFNDSPRPSEQLRHAGFLGRRLGGGNLPELTAADFAPELKLNYAIFDLAALAMLEFLGIAALAVLGLRLLFLPRQSRRLTLLGWRGYLRWLLFGILLPLALYWLWTRIDLVSGRDWAMPENRLRLGLQLAFLVLGVPLISVLTFRRQLRRHDRSRRLPTVLTANLIPALAVTLLLTALLLRPLLAARIDRLLREDRLMLGRNLQQAAFSEPEQKLVEQLREEHRNFFRQESRRPLRLAPEPES